MVEDEKRMYSFIEKFLKERKDCEKVLSERVSFEYIKRWVIDVAGIKGARIYAVEAKPRLNFDSFSAALTQARYYRQACTHVYICLPKPQNQREKELLQHVKEICRKEGIGLLLQTPTGETRVEEEVEVSKPDLDRYYQVMQQLTRETLSNEAQGARAYIIRDLCYYLHKQFNGETSKQNLLTYPPQKDT
ncbi:MAG: hypothetical protein DRN81_03570 [Thermoproteota archaeon]|nr:MAG: hypothetical protein DRN81_03570 [Candidatus Korarchaeota archaeon]